jgi:hypothetical protein
MIRKWFSVTALVITACVLLSVSSCARNQHLVSIAIQPGDGTFGGVDPNLSFQYRAYGTYVHPPKTTDITDQATWQTSSSQVVQFTSPGLVSPNTNCGVAQVFATMHDSPNDIVSNTVSITVKGPVTLGCPQGSGSTNTLQLDVTNVNDGTIVSSPGGIICPFACSAVFPMGTLVTLSATPIPGQNFTGWGTGCDSQSVMNCSVLMNADRTVTASFD